MTLTTFKKNASKVYAWVQVGELNDTSDDGGGGAGTGISNSRTSITVRNTRFNGEANSIGHRIEEGMEVLIDSEIMKVTDCDNRTDTGITVVRGEHTHAKIGSIGGAAAAHLTGAALYAWSELKDLATGSPLVQHLTITDSLYEPRMLEITLTHPPQTNRYGVGTLEGLLTERTPLKVVEGENFSILFRGNINRITRQHALEEGNTLDITAYDELYEFGRSKLAGEDAEIKINDGNAVKVAIADGGLNQSGNAAYNISDIIKAYIQRFQSGGSATTLGVGDNVTTVETVSGSVLHFEDSSEVKDASRINGTVNLGGSNASVLRALTRLALSDNLLSSSKFGYTFYIDPNHTTLSTAYKPPAMFNYFKSSFMPAQPSHTSPQTFTMNIDYDASGGITEKSNVRLMKPGASFDILDIDRVNVINARFRNPQTGVLEQVEFEIFNYDKYRMATATGDSSQMQGVYTFKPFVAPLDTNDDEDISELGVIDPKLRLTAAFTNWDSRVVDSSDNLIGYLQYISNPATSSTSTEVDREGFILVSKTSTRRANSTVVAGEKLFVNKASANDYVQLTSVTDPSKQNAFRPQQAANEKIMINMDFGFVDSFDTIREGVAAKFSQTQAAKVRGRFQVEGKYPTTCFDQQAIGDDTIATTTDVSYTITEFTDASRASGIQEHGNTGFQITNYSMLGLRAGHSIAKLTGANGTVDTYGYLARVATSNTGVDLTFKLNSGTISANDYFRLHVPLRAGHNLDVSSGFHNIGTTTGGRCIVTSLVYYESGETSYTDIETIGLSQSTGQEVIAAPRPLLDNLDGYTDDDYTAWAPFTELGTAVAPHFTGSITPGLTNGNKLGQGVHWTEGLFYYGGRVYDIAAGDNSSVALSTGDTGDTGFPTVTHVIYFEPGLDDDAFKLTTLNAFELRNEESGTSSVKTNVRPYAQTRIKIATCYGTATNTNTDDTDNAGVAKIFPHVSVGSSKKADGSSAGTTDADFPPLIIGGPMLSGEVSRHWVPSKDNTHDLGTITGGTGSTDFRWKDLYINPSSSKSATTDLNIDSDGLVHKVSSSAIYKENIKELEIDTTKIYDLKPSNFNFKTTPEKLDFGLIAEEVEKFIPELISYTREGKPEAVKYSLLSVLLLQEIKKLKQEIDNLKDEAEE